MVTNSWDHTAKLESHKVTPQRSWNMSQIRSVGNQSTEQRLVGLLRAWGIRGWRRHAAVFGKPDFVFWKFKLAVFVDGCFWHSCPRCSWKPKTNQLYWNDKLARNRERDRSVSATLKQRGWRVLRIWEHSLAKPAQVHKRLIRVLEERG